MQIFKNKKVIIMFGGWACALVLLLSFTCASFAKYVSGKVSNEKSDVASFACSINITNVDTVFGYLNADYLHTDSNSSSNTDSGTVMNYPATASFQIENYVGDYVAEVAMNYSLVFYIPATFAMSAAIQITDNASTAYTPLYVLSDFINPSNDPVQTQSFVKTEDGGIEDRYGSLAGADEQTFTYEIVSATEVIFTADDGTIKVEEMKLQSEIVRSFPCFTRKASSQSTETSISTLASTTEEGNESGAQSDENSQIDKKIGHIYLTTTEEVTYYKFTISHESFKTLPAGTKTSYSYGLRLVPTKGMSKQTTGDDSSTEKSSVIDTDYIKNWTEFYKQNSTDWTYTDDDYYLSFQTESDSVTLNIVDSEGITIYQNVIVENLDGKSYPCRLNALFEQTTGTE